MGNAAKLSAEKTGQSIAAKAMTLLKRKLKEHNSVVLCINLSRNRTKLKSIFKIVRDFYHCILSRPGSAFIECCKGKKKKKNAKNGRAFLFKNFQKLSDLWVLYLARIMTETLNTFAENFSCMSEKTQECHCFSN